VCGADETGRLVVQDYLTGGLPSFPLFDTNNDGFITASDHVVGGFNAGAVIGGSTLIGAPVGGTGAIVSSDSLGGLGSKKKAEVPGASGRINWREILR
jgi:type IV pilus assembly protein PilY1